MNKDNNFKNISIVIEAIIGTIVAMMLTSILIHMLGNISGAVCNMLLDVMIFSTQIVIIYVNFRGNILKRVGMTFSNITGKRFIQTVSLAFIGVFISYIIIWIFNVFRFEGSSLAFRYVTVLFVQMLFVAIAEEVLFRGVIQGHLQKITGPKLALVVSTIIFTVFHCTVIYSVTQVIDIFVLGFIMGLLYMKTNSIAYSIGFHFGIDFAINLVGMQDSGALFIISSNHSDNYVASMLFGTMSVLGIGIIGYLYKKK